MMHMSSSDVNPKTRFAGTHRPVYVASVGQSESAAQRLAEPSRNAVPLDSRKASRMDRPGTFLQTPSAQTPRVPQSRLAVQAWPSLAKCSSQPYFMGFAFPLSWVQV